MGQSVGGAVPRPTGPTALIAGVPRVAGDLLCRAGALGVPGVTAPQGLSPPRPATEGPDFSGLEQGLTLD